MAYSTGTATNQNDLMDRLKTFLTTAGPTGPGWTALKDTTVAASPADGANRYILFDAPGGGSDNIYVGIELNMARAFSANLFEFYRPFFRLQGYTGHNAGLAFDDQPGAIPTYNNVPTFAVEHDRALPYHFIANGRRCIIAVQTGRKWSTAYLGWYLPFGTPAQVPYPMMIAGSNYTNTSQDSEEVWEDRHIAFSMGTHDTDVGGNIQHLEGANWVSMADRIWPLYDFETGDSSTFSQDNELFWRDDFVNTSTYAEGDYTLCYRNLDNSIPLIPLHITGDESGQDIFGVYDGVFAAGGARRVLQDDIVDIGGVDHLLVEAIHYSRGSMIALKLE